MTNPDPPAYVLGFTGTRKGMSERQRRALKSLLRDRRYISLHHGGAIGADVEAAALARLTRGPDFPIICHPAGSDPLGRNRRIVAACDVLVAAPDSNIEQLRSGTWATVRYGRQAGRRIILLAR